jgi:hypothetical protein
MDGSNIWTGSLRSIHYYLFLGSGFSTEAKNRLNKAPPSGTGLKVAIGKLSKVDSASYTLADLAEYCAETNKKGLFDLIQGSFRIIDLSRDQKDILAAPWKRIYTTNFDDAAEWGRQFHKLAHDSYSFEQDKPSKISDGAVIHLHGVVRNVTEENVLEQIVLGERAYVQQHVDRPLWYDQFLYDIKFSKACFFVGYSLSDKHIAALLIKNPRSQQKTIFIERDEIPDRVFVSRIAKYGQIEPIGLDGFAKLVRERQEPIPISDFHSLRSFKVMEGQPDRRTFSKPTVIETRDLLIHGRLSVARLMASLPEPIYALPREKDADRATQILANNRSLIIDGRLGNGKTIFQQILFAKLAPHGYRCLIVRDVEEVAPAEIDFLKEQKNVVLVFDTYAKAQSLIEGLSEALPNAKFIVEVRSSLLEIRLFEIDSKVPKPFGRITLNRLSDDDRSDFLELCKSASVIIPNSISTNERLELRDLLLAVFQTESIRNKIKADLTKTFKDPSARKIVTVVFLMQMVQADPDPDFLKLVTMVDPFNVLSLNIEGSQEVLSISDGEVALRSSVFAEYVMQEFVPASDLSDAIYDCALFCANRKSNRRYRTLLTLFMQYSRINPMYVKRKNGIDQLRSLYERLRWYPNIKDEPLFWLQFAILETNEGHYLDAKRYIDFSYAEAELRPGFLTYQIDTQYLRLLIDMAMEQESGLSENLFEDLVKYIRLVGYMLADDSHRHFAFSVLDRVPEMIIRMRPKMTNGEKMGIRISVQNVIVILDRSSPDFLAQTGGALLANRLKVQVQNLAT